MKNVLSRVYLNINVKQRAQHGERECISGTQRMQLTRFDLYDDNIFIYWGETTASEL